MGERPARPRCRRGRPRLEKRKTHPRYFAIESRRRASRPHRRSRDDGEARRRPPARAYFLTLRSRRLTAKLIFEFLQKIIQLHRRTPQQPRQYVRDLAALSLRVILL